MQSTHKHKDKRKKSLSDRNRLEGHQTCLDFVQILAEERKLRTVRVAAAAAATEIWNYHRGQRQLNGAEKENVFRRAVRSSLTFVKLD